MSVFLPEKETIVALATPVGTSAIAVVRASGPACATFARESFKRALQARRAHYEGYRMRDGSVLDDVLAIHFPAPASYTGEHVLEISCHGNPFVVRRLLEDLCARGCRLAEPGEFTQRAFLNGRLDLSQAEAVMDVIQARSTRALAFAQRKLQGALGRHLAVLNRELLDALARVEAYIDFPDEDLPAEDREIVRAGVERALDGTRRLLATRRYGEILRSGIRTVIVGAPNVGKSSLLNRIVGYERAIVSAEPGTTRDFIEESVTIGDHAFRLTDTAGLNPNPGEIERRGIEKTYERMREADLVLWVVDLTAPFPTLPAELAALLRPETALKIGNKCDSVSPEDAARILAGVSEGESAPVAGLQSYGVSALSGQGIPEAMAAIGRIADAHRVETGDESIAVNARHAHALERAAVSLTAALEMFAPVSSGVAPAPEFVASDLREALAAFGEISGKFDNERMLDRLFATFCIGK